MGHYINRVFAVNDQNALLAGPWEAFAEGAHSYRESWPIWVMWQAANASSMGDVRKGRGWYGQRHVAGDLHRPSTSAVEAKGGRAVSIVSLAILVVICALSSDTSVE